MKKRMLSLTLALVMLLGIMPVAHAEDAYLWPSDSTSTSQNYGNGHNGQDITSTKGSDIYATKSGTVVAVYTGCANNNAAYTNKNCGSAIGCNPSLNYYDFGTGKVVKDSDTAKGLKVCNYGYGNGLAIKHSDGSGYSTYSHMQSVSVTVGQTVVQGDVVGTMGSAGNSTGTHCHFELVSEGSMTEGGKYFRPTKWINNNKSAVTYIYPDGSLGVQFLPAAQSTWADKEKVEETNAVVVAQIKKNNGVKVTEVGLALYDAGGTLLKSYSQKVTTPDTSTSWPCYWDINEEIGVTLTPGTTYKYCFTGVFNGTKYESEMWSFKTGGTKPETSSPTPEPPVTPSSEPEVTTSPGSDDPGPADSPKSDSKLSEKFSAVREWSVLQFDDISTKAWYYENVKSAYCYDLMNGRGASEFAPEGTLTIAESITLAVRIHARYYGKTIPSYDGGIWYDGYVSYALQNGIYAEGPYDDPATREVFARILAAALPIEELRDNGNSISFADEDQIHYLSSVELLCQAGVINGDNRGGLTFFDPADTITRAQAAAIVTRMVIPDLRTHP